ncbi:hypothetical protein ACH5RR_039200 [Cinchona calisaya]|uniref:Uncharacterized protein n=1 Tax=Cinchona calisaya TaxID=153742 RepID=A0ABD2Y104_9GENT
MIEREVKEARSKWVYQRKEEPKAKTGEKVQVKESKKAGEKQANYKVQTVMKIEGLEPIAINMVVALYRSFMPSEEQLYYVREQEELNRETEDSVQIRKGPNMAIKVILTKQNAKMAYHLKPLFVQGHLNGITVSRMMVDNRAKWNLSGQYDKRLGKTTEDLIPTNIVVSSFTRGAMIREVSYPWTSHY